MENFLLFTEIPTETMLQRQIYVQNIQYDILLRKGGYSFPKPGVFAADASTIVAALYPATRRRVLTTMGWHLAAVR